MAASTKRRTSGPVMRSLSPSERFFNPRYTSPAPASASAFASSTSIVSSRSSSFFQRSTSPTRVSMPAPSVSPWVRFSIDRSTSPSRSMSQALQNRLPAGATGQKRTCMCSPTTHPGSFRCSLHKNFGGSPSRQSAAPYRSNRLNARRSAMTNSLVRICTVEGDLVKRALAALIRPSSHQQKRRAAFQPRPSRLSLMSKAGDLL
ncbi:hypothetical protein Dimus_034304 [Dionaea muscipula]